MLLGRPGCGAQAGERGGQLGGPWPVFVDLELPGAGGAGEPGGDVQQPVAQRRRLAAGQFAVQAEHLGPGEQVGRGQAQFEPDLVLVIAATRQVAQPCCFPAADAVLDAGVGAVPYFQVGQLPVRGVGEEGGEAVPVDVGEAQLRTGVWSFTAHDHPRSGRPGPARCGDARRCTSRRTPGSAVGRPRSSRNGRGSRGGT